MKPFLFLLLFSLSVWAEPYYCPEKIECQNKSCDLPDAPFNHWQKISGATQTNGIFHLTYVSAPFFVSDQGVALCVYTHQFTKQTVTLHAKPESHLEMLIQDHEPWRQEESWWECKPKGFEQACPLQKQVAFTLKNQTPDILYVSDGQTILPGQFLRLYQTNLSFPVLNIYNAYNYIGQVLLDTEKNLRLVQILEADPTYTTINQTEGFNAVEISAILNPAIQSSRSEES